MSLARKIFSNTAWQIAGKAVTAVLGIVSIKFITNYLSRSTYGEYTTIYDYTALFAIIADFGLFTIAVREMAHANSRGATEKIVGNVLSIRTILAILALGAGILAAAVLPAYHGSHIPFGVFIVSVGILVTLIATTMSSVLQFSLRMHWASISLSLGKAITVGYILYTILYLFPLDPNAGFPHLQLAWIFGSTVTLIITYVASRQVVPIHFQFDFEYWKEIFLKALPYGTALVLGTIYFRMGTIALSLFKLKEQVGYYGVPIRFLEILQIIPHYFMGSVLPILTISLLRDRSRAEKIVRYSLNALGALAIPSLVGGFILAWPITAAVSSPDFLSHRAADGSLVLGSDFALKMLLVGMTFTYFHVVLSYSIVAMGKQKELLLINGVTVIINVILNFTLAPRFGFIGAATAAVVSEISMLIGLLWRIHGKLNHIWDFVFLAKTGLSAAVMGLFLLAISDFFNERFFSGCLFILIPVAAIIFAGMMFLTRAVSKEMMALLKKGDSGAGVAEGPVSSEIMP